MRRLKLRMASQRLGGVWLKLRRAPGDRSDMADRDVDPPRAIGTIWRTALGMRRVETHVENPSVVFYIFSANLEHGSAKGRALEAIPPIQVAESGRPGARSKFLAKAPQSGGHRPRRKSCPAGVKLSANLREAFVKPSANFGKTSGEPVFRSAAFWKKSRKNWSRFNKNSAKFVANLLKNQRSRNSDKNPVLNNLE